VTAALVRLFGRAQLDLSGTGRLAAAASAHLVRAEELAWSGSWTRACREVCRAEMCGYDLRELYEAVLSAELGAAA
jgi:hypothetical protein